MGEKIGVCQKRTDYVIGIQKVAPGTEFYNHLENTHYTTDETRCYVLTGAANEQWPVDEAKLKKTYNVENLMDRINAGEKVMANPLPSADKIYAEIADKETQVHTSWGDVLTAHEGDVIAYSMKDGEINKDDSWVINKDIFRTTYKKSDGKEFSKTLECVCENLDKTENHIAEELKELEQIKEDNQAQLK